jgi:hypothetical protein
VDAWPCLWCIFNHYSRWPLSLQTRLIFTAPTVLYSSTVRVVRRIASALIPGFQIVAGQPVNHVIYGYIICTITGATSITSQSAASPLPICVSTQARSIGWQLRQKNKTSVTTLISASDIPHLIPSLVGLHDYSALTLMCKWDNAYAKYPYCK